MSETHNFVYWNCLYDAETAPMDYAREVLDVLKPKAFIIEELQDIYSEQFDRLSAKFGMKSVYDVAVRWKGSQWGTYAMLREDIGVMLEQRSVAYPIGYEDRRWYCDEYDDRKLTSAIVRIGGSEVGLVSARQSHPHHFYRHPQRNFRRAEEWRTMREEIDQHISEGVEVIAIGDTNTFLARSVKRRLGLDERDMTLLEHTAIDGVTRTWGPLRCDRKILYLDRASVTSGLVGRTVLHTLPDTINDVQHTSDHSAIMVAVRS